MLILNIFYLKMEKENALKNAQITIMEIILINNVFHAMKFLRVILLYFNLDLLDMLWNNSI